MSIAHHQLETTLTRGLDWLATYLGHFAPGDVPVQRPANLLAAIRPDTDDRTFPYKMLLELVILCLVHRRVHPGRRDARVERFLDLAEAVYQQPAVDVAASPPKREVLTPDGGEKRPPRYHTVINLERSKSSVHVSSVSPSKERTSLLSFFQALNLRRKEANAPAQPATEEAQVVNKNKGSRLVHVSNQVSDLDI